MFIKYFIQHLLNKYSYKKGLERQGKDPESEPSYDEWLDSQRDENVNSLVGWFQRLFTNIGKRYLGTGLTDSEKEANEFTATEAEKVRNQEIELANTAYQREVTDMQAAGVNPALLYNRGSSGSVTPSMPAATSVSPQGMGFQDLLSLVTLPMKLKEMSANIGLMNAKSRNTDSDTDLNSLEAEFMQRTMEARVRGEELKNKLSEEQIKEIEDNRKLISENIKKVIEETKNEEEKRYLIQMQAKFEEAKANEIAALLPLQENLLKAQTSAQKMNALAAYWQAMYSQDMITSGYVDAMCDSLRDNALANMKGADARKAESEVNVALGEFKKRVYNGEAIDVNKIPKWRLVSRFAAKRTNEILSQAAAVSTAVGGPLAGLIGSAPK